MKKKITIIAIFLFVAMIPQVILLVYKNYNNKIQDGYMFVFHGAKDNIVYESYVYRITKDKNNYRYEIVNVETINNKSKVKVRSYVIKPEEIFKVAKNNNAYDYVTLTDREEKYKIEDFKEMFINNEKGYNYEKK